MPSISDGQGTVIKSLYPADDRGGAGIQGETKGAGQLP